MRLPLAGIVDWGRIPNPVTALPTKIPSAAKAVPLYPSPEVPHDHDHPKDDRHRGHRPPRRVGKAPPFKRGPIPASAQQHADWFWRR